MLATLVLAGGFHPWPVTLHAQQAEPATAAGAEALGYLADLPPLVDREIFFGNPEISGGQLSPDGRWVSFVKPLDGIRNIWVKGIEEPFEAARPMTADSTRPVTGYFWSQDSRVILFVQDQGGNENYHVYAVDPGSAPAAGAKVPTALDLTPLEDVRAAIYAVPENDPAHILAGLNDRDPAVHDVYRIDIRTGERELVLRNDENVAQWVADLDGNLRLGVRQREDGGWEILRVDGAALTPIYTCSAEETCWPDRFHKDGARVYLQTNKGEGDLVRLELMDAGTGATEPVESDPEGEVDFGEAIFSNATEELIGTVYVGDRRRIYARSEDFAQDLERIREVLPDGDYGFHSMTEDGRLMLVSLDSDVDPSSTYVFDRETGDAELLYRVRPEIPSQHMARLEPVRYTARDGLEIPAYLTVPKGVEPRNLAVVVLPHGGPWARDEWGFDGIAQFLANRGYAVLQPNFRGSTGYGKEFLNLGNEQWGTGTMQHDITDGVQWLIDQGVADPERVAIMGGSYGGYATLAGMAFTPELYAAGVDIVGPSSILTLLNSIPPYWKPLQRIFAVRVGDLNDPEDIERMKAQSPLHAADRIQAPLLVIQGANDPRVKKAESDQIVVALREKGQAVEYLVADNEGHGFANEDNTLAMFAKIEEFLAAHLGGRYQEDVRPEIEETLARLSVDVGTVELASATGEDAGETIVAFEGAAVEDGARRYEQRAETQGRTIELASTREVSRTDWEGRAALLVVESSQGTAGSAVDSTWVDPETLVPIRRAIRQGPATIALSFEDGTVTGRIEAGPQSLPVDVRAEGPVFSTGPALELALSTLALEPGTAGSVQLFEVLEGRVKPYRVQVGEPGNVETPAGAIEAAPVALAPADGSPGGQTVWVETAEPHRVVKVEATLPAMMGGGTATSVLADGERP